MDESLLKAAQNRISALEELVWLYKGFLPNFYKGRRSNLWIHIHENEENTKVEWEKVLMGRGE